MYNRFMLRGLLWAILLLGISSASWAQVRVKIPPQELKPRGLILATIQNDSSEPITVCMQVGQIAPAGTFAVGRPIPFVVQKTVKDTWQTLLIAPDVGSARVAVVLDSRKSYDFPFWFSGAGTLRVVLHYWRGSQPNLDCATNPHGKKTAKSRPFLIPLIEYLSQIRRQDAGAT
jgi:hypothetical protein